VDKPNHSNDLRLNYQERTLGRRLKGFTTLELLIVIGLILFLISLMFLGLRHVTTQARIADTKTQLQNAQTLLKNYENATHFQRFPVISGTQDIGFWTTDQVTLYPGSVSNNVFQTNGLNNFSPDGGGLSDTGTAPMSTSPNVSIMQRTLLVMQMLMTVPENATLIGNLPSGKTKSFMLTVNGTPGVSVPVLMDSWGNPILFVPAGGMVNTYLSADPLPVPSPAPVQFSTGRYPNGHLPPQSSPLPPQQPSDRPFFFSVGPDGDASLGDDNLYSFQNQ
jgi:type II secretory pathway pseudopilin PulG